MSVRQRTWPRRPGNDLLFASTVLLNFELPFECPRTVQCLFDYLEAKGGLGYRLLAHMMIASERIPDDSPLYVGIGAPSHRGGGRRQAACGFHHLPIQQPLHGTGHPRCHTGVDRLHLRHLVCLAERSPCAVVSRD